MSGIFKMVYLDSGATSFPKPDKVLRAMEHFIRKVGANPGRSGYKKSIEAGRIVFETRELLAQLFGVSDSRQIVFTSNATEALNLSILGVLENGDHIITSSMEHNSVMRPLKFLEEKKRVELSVVECSLKGIINLEKIVAKIKDNTKLIVITHGSNIIGTLMPLKEIGKIARKHGILFLVDAAQTAGAYPINVEELNVDMLAFTGHKSLLGPQGTGGLYIRKGVEIKPLKRGGTGSNSEHEFQPDFLPDKYESGTLNTVGIAGLGASVKFILDEGVGKIRKREMELTYQLIKALESIDEIKVYGTKDPDKQISVISINIEGLEPSEVGYIFDQVFDIMVRVGLHCAPAAHKTIGTFPHGTVRMGIGYFTTPEDIDYVVGALKKIILEKK